MGLAASQARLLLLTSRKDDVEGSLMFLANQKLAMARKSAGLSKDYSEALNSTKLMWNNGSSTDLDLTYGLLMNYNTDNEKGQYMVADNYGHAVLNDTYANILMGSGKDSISGGVLPLTDEQFLQRMGFTAQNAADCKQAYLTNSNAGTAVGDYNDNDIWNYMNAHGTLQSLDSSGNYTTSTDTDYSNATNKDTSLVIRCSADSLNIQDGLQTTLNNIYDDIGAALGAKSTLNSSALSDAETKTTSHYMESLNEAAVDGSGQHTKKYESDAIPAVRGTNDISESWNHTNTYFLDVNQLIKTFLNYYDGCCAEQNSAGAGSKYFKAVKDPSGGAYGVTTRISASATGGEPENFDKASFYLNMYYYTQANGAVRSSGIDKDNGSYMQNQFQNGSLHLCKYTGDTDWDAVSTSNEESLISTKSDEDNITAAEAKYNAQKDDLDYKESQIDLQITNLDTERSALDTEVDSVKTVLNKNIERSFKLFQNA